jgi:hypothetical protein
MTRWVLVSGATDVLLLPETVREPPLGITRKSGKGGRADSRGQQEARFFYSVSDL